MNLQNYVQYKIYYYHDYFYFKDTNYVFSKWEVGKFHFLTFIKEYYFNHASENIVTQRKN